MVVTTKNNNDSAALEEYAKGIEDLAKEQNIYEIGKHDYNGSIPEELFRFLRETEVFYNLVPLEAGGEDSVTRWLYGLRAVGACCSTTVHIMTTQSLCVYAFRLTGADKSKQSLFKQLIDLEKHSCFCLTEPNGGTDAGNMQTLARKTGGGYVISGEKNMIMNADFADYFLTAARLEGVEGYGGITLFLIPKDSPGLSVGPPDRTMGLKGVPINRVFYDEVAVTKEQMIGSEGDGWKTCMKILDRTRPGVAAAAVGAARTAFRMGIDYAGERTAFNKPIIKFQTTTNRISEIGLSLESAWLMIDQAGRNLDEQKADVSLSSSMAKIYGTEAALQAANEAMQFFGGYGYLEDYRIEKICRDLRVGVIYDGTNEILRGITAAGLIKKYGTNGIKG